MRRPGSVEQPPRQPAGRLARGSANLGLSLTSRKSALCPTGGVQNALFRDPNLPECAFPSRRDRRMRFSVRVPAQNAPFRRVRFFSPGQTSSHLTENRILSPMPHGKAHSAPNASRKSALCAVMWIAQTAPFRYVAAPGKCGATPRQPAGHYGECLNWANALEQPPASLRGGLREGPQISV